MSDVEYPLLPDGYWERRETEALHVDEAAEPEEEFPPVAFPDGAGQATVWLAHPAEDLRRNHGMVVLARGDTATAYELGGWKEEKPIARLMALAGYAPSKPLGTGPRVVEVAAQAFVPIMGFRVPNAMLGAITMRVDQAMRGELGGFSSLSLGQLGFHQAHTAFMAAWQAAGSPEMHVRKPQWVDLGAGTGVPLPLAGALEKHVGHGSSLAYWEGQQLIEDESDDLEGSL
jgi:hypothetical protein